MALGKLVNIGMIQFEKAALRARSSLWKARIQRAGGRVGRDFCVRRGALLGLSTEGKLEIGDGVTIGEGAGIYVGPLARLRIGAGVFIGRNSTVAANQEISIGAQTQIAHGVTVIPIVVTAAVVAAWAGLSVSELYRMGRLGQDVGGKAVSQGTPT